ncbi:MAG: MFS transporter, partial [Acetobacteraceae bacterium]|nr:MFS transporter [Acetobacteraceae bacterium]
HEHIPHYRWIIAGLLFVANAINYLDRSALSIVAPLVIRDLGFDAAELGIIFSAFFVGYSVFCFVGGWASDRWGPKLVFAVAMVWWSLFCGATALITGFVSLLIVRVLFGIGEGPMGSTTNKTITNWFPREEAATMVGITNAGNPIGGAISGPIVGIIAAAFSWRVSFVAITLIGLTWVAFWWWLVTDTPAQNPNVTPAERDLVARSRALAPAGDDPMTTIAQWLRSPTVLAIALAFFSYNYVLYFFLTWLPTYLTYVHHLNIQQMSIVTVLPWACGSVGMVLGGLLADGLFRRTGNSILSRKIVLVGALSLAAIMVIIAPKAETLTFAIALIAAANLFLLMAPQNCWALIQETVPASRVGGVGGYVHFLSNLAGIIGPALTGFLVQYGGGYTASFILAGVLAAIGALAVMLLVRGKAEPV